MDQFILQEKNGFVKGRYILHAIIALLEGTNYANESNQSFIFRKIDFAKPYDTIDWDFVL